MALDQRATATPNAAPRPRAAVYIGIFDPDKFRTTLFDLQPGAGGAGGLQLRPPRQRASS
jgi:hypothetical protein